MKRSSLLAIIIALSTLLFSCGKSNLNSKEEAIKFLETNRFYDDDASISGKSGGSLKSSFSIEFQNGNALIGEESMPYTISELITNGNAPSYNSNQFNGFEIQFCGSNRYAYGGCIKCYLNSGLKSDDGPYLTVKGDYVKAHFSYVTKGAITKK